MPSNLWNSVFAIAMSGLVSLPAFPMPIEWIAATGDWFNAANGNTAQVPPRSSTSTRATQPGRA